MRQQRPSQRAGLPCGRGGRGCASGRRPSAKAVFRPSRTGSASYRPPAFRLLFNSKRGPLRPAAGFQNGLQQSRGVTDFGGVANDILRRAVRHDPPAAGAGLGAEVDQPVRRFYHVEVMFDHADGVAALDQPVQDFEQLGDVRQMEPRRRFVQQIEGAAGVRAGQFRGQLDPLRLPARQRRGALGRATDNPARSPSTPPARPESWGRWRTSRRRRRCSCRVRRRSSGLYRSRPASPPCSVCRRRRRSRPRRPAGNAFRFPLPHPLAGFAAPPGRLKLNRPAYTPAPSPPAARQNSSRIRSKTPV